MCSYSLFYCYSYTRKKTGMESIFRQPLRSWWCSYMLSLQVFTLIDFENLFYILSCFHCTLRMWSSQRKCLLTYGVFVITKLPCSGYEIGFCLWNDFDKIWKSQISFFLVKFQIIKKPLTANEHSKDIKLSKTDIKSLIFLVKFNLICNHVDN